MSPKRTRLSVDEARAHSERAMRGIGYDQEEARIVVDHAIDAALCGYEYSGLAKLLNIPEHRRFKQPRRPISVLRETGLSTLYDGGNNVGMLAMYHATRGAIAKAAARGIAIVGVTNSWMSGRSAYYVEMIANAGLVGIHTAGSAPSVAPRGHACGARHQPDCLRAAVIARTGRLRYGDLGLHGDGPGIPRAPGRGIAGGGGNRRPRESGARSREGATRRAPAVWR